MCTWLYILRQVASSKDISGTAVSTHYTHDFIPTSVFLLSSYGAPLDQRASYLALHSSLFGPVVQLIMIILSLTALTLY